MKSYRVKLKFKGPVHFGYKEKMDNVTEYIVHSDTLFSGILNCYSLLYGKKRTDEIVERVLCEDLPFKLSSAFLYIDEEYLIPKPINLDLSAVVGDFKKAKKIRYVPLDYSYKQAKSEVYIKGPIMITKNYDRIFSIDERPRVTLDRIEHSSEIYYLSSCTFGENVGLWFYLDVYDTGIEKEIQAAIRLLGDEGLGGERTYGFGLFCVDFCEEKDNFDLESDQYLLLSLFLPSEDDDLKDGLISYELTERGGYVYSPFSSNLKKKKVRMFLEGSVFKKKYNGKIADVTPDNFNTHKVLRYGIPYWKPILLSGQRG
ncbi:type III-A CRISPR-associated RAMP protein Csm4 [Caldanaerobius polysaccharolyticus]|uniref:type III-A CRISPR-associated RAMP protein Csm4 n=1 Tax=Caldanaerobius polysaccharolyticus TaxID=44256 RepID=UPI00047D917B|nr:type III-A CRISPR-associated RAMP protein Csm4 [Caldanaerobius polysaccharolyticus]